MKKSNKVFLGITGILLILLGIMCMLRPVGALVTTVWVAGVVMIVTGISTLVFSLRTQTIMPNAASSTLSGIVQIMLGFLFLINPVVTAASLPLILAIWIIFESISLAIRSFDFKKVGFASWWLMLLLGVAGVVLGIVALCNLSSFTEGTSKVMGVMVGLGIIVAGIVRLVALSGIRRFEKRVGEAREEFDNRMGEIRETIKDRIEENKA